MVAAVQRRIPPALGLPADARAGSSAATNCWTHARGRSIEAFDRSIDLLVSRLRQKLADDPKAPQLIKTVRGAGYLFDVRSVQGQPASQHGCRAPVARLVPSTLFGRLALLLFVAVLASHVLALTLMFELRPPPPPGALRPGPPPGMHPGLLLDIGVRLGALMLAAWIGARWLSQPIRQLAAAARDIGLDIRRPPMAEQGTEECRAATRVFSQMQAQICRQLDERDRFVAPSRMTCAPR